ncbi:hypothetical protein M527_16970 [Sphingobium indicum IP26]|nr:hypothetical protein M527_16970 [Sphingobium indicum IP26]
MSQAEEEKKRGSFMRMADDLRWGAGRLPLHSPLRKQKQGATARPVSGAS